METEFIEAQAEAIAAMIKAHGHFLTKRAIQHMDKAIEDCEGNWTATHKVLDEQKYFGRSHTIALEMFETFCEILHGKIAS